jgi:hypothetical protein
LNDAALRTKATNAILAVIGTETSQSYDQWLAAGRNVGAYTIAADVLNLRADGNPSSDGSRIQAWIALYLTRTLLNQAVPTTITSWVSGSNASAQIGFVHAAIAAYLNDTNELTKVWNGYRRYVGDRTSPHTMTSNDLSWQFIPSDPVGIQDAGATKSGCRLDGAIGNDMSRGGSFSCTPGYTSYPWVGLEGAYPAAMILERAGYPAFNHGNQALKRALDYLWHVRTVTGNAAWFDGNRAADIVWLGNVQYGTSYPVSLPVGAGRTVGWTDWTHPGNPGPSVSITTPANGATVSGTIAVSAVASGNVVGVQFMRGGVNLGSEDTTSPYSVSWNTTSVSDGSHTLTAVARDASGDTTTSSPVVVTVSNVVVPDLVPPTRVTNLNAP